MKSNLTIFWLLSLFLLPLFFVGPAQAQMQDYPSVKLQTLDKATARTNTLEAVVGSTVQFGSLFIKVQSCRESSPLDQPESAAFLQIWEVPINSDKSEWVFSGWMFASSPALSAMDHPVYDVWVLDCVGKEPEPVPAKAEVTIKNESDTDTDEGTELETDAVMTQENGAESLLNNPQDTDKSIESVIESVITEQQQPEPQNTESQGIAPQIGGEIYE